MPARLIRAILPDSGQLASIDRMLELTRRHLDMDLMIVGEFVGGQRVMRNVVADDPGLGGLKGTSETKDSTYCGLIAEGRIPPLLKDASCHELTRDLEITERLGVRSYVGVPITMSDGEVFGTLCCFAHEPDRELTGTELGLVTLVAGLIATHIEDERAAELSSTMVRTRIHSLVEAGQPSMVFQPIVELATGTVSGHEALARFDTHPPAPPDVWFASANDAGCGPELEAAAIRAALRWLPEVPHNQCMNLNVGTAALGDPHVQDELLRAPLERITLEITEQNVLEHPHQSHQFIATSRKLGARIAIDDLGAGYSGLHRVLQLSPDVIKLDRELVSGLDQDPARLALVRAASTFSASIGSEVVAEGVEHAAELTVLQEIGVTHAQGYHLGRPAAAPWRSMTPDQRVVAPR
jgi:EAL domain-containing protein (putative c-di-GMP-specific phosphodiesterase class I)